MSRSAQHVGKLVSKYAKKYQDDFIALGSKDPETMAFLALCVSYYLEKDISEVLEYITDGGNDRGIDALYYEEINGECYVTIFQSKYKKNSSGENLFPENEIKKLNSELNMVLGDMGKVKVNDRLKPKLEEISSLESEGIYPRYKIVLCNNGKIWADSVQPFVDELEESCDAEVIHINHESIVESLSVKKPVKLTLKTTGESFSEDMSNLRVFIGRVEVSEIFRIIEEHGDKILERNVRKFLGISKSRVNNGISKTLRSEKSENFYFYNNGITIVCDKFEYNRNHKSDRKVTIHNANIVNGGQTCKTIHETLKEEHGAKIGEFSSTMVKIIQVPDDDEEFLQDIAYHTNSQNSIELHDLKANHPYQKRLEEEIKALDYIYKRKREASGGGTGVITSQTVAEATLAIWRQKPHLSKFKKSLHFDRLFDEIFRDLNGAQAILAVLIFRDVENIRKRPGQWEKVFHIPYSSHYMAMMIGHKFLKECQYNINDVNLDSFQSVIKQYAEKKDDLYRKSIFALSEALEGIGIKSNQSTLAKISAAFRRDDLLRVLLEDYRG